MEGIRYGWFNNGNGSETAPVQATLHIVHKGSVGAYTPTAEDNGAYMVFDFDGDVQMTLPAALSYPEANPFSMFVVNTLGGIAFLPETPFVGYAPYASQNVTCGLLRGTANWYATGTNNKEELA
ncbi:hypothetical protein QGX11_gp123 [Pseudomonas phage PPSC2]|uniref:Uncharacterized protein n=1 Tax=Pseudomonas phage PPSC2 TaxID=2041350 RepID=A0A2R2YAU0_9CAUD|nr:hypothetical protein QGX11_gp123 [Pseudomonas phage PPSC2]ATN92886.1 hypothetical protein PPSC2_123 [Pseudomonas phage PPSC2]